MPSLDYQLDKMEKILMTLRRSNRIIAGLKEKAESRQLNKLAIDCASSVKATEGVIEYIEELKEQTLADMNMIEVPVKVEEPEKPKFPPYLRRVK